MPEKFNFLEQVNRTFDRAGVLTDHDPTLLRQIRECDGRKLATICEPVNRISRDCHG